MAVNEGEEIVSNQLKQNFKKDSNYICANITLPINNDGTTQIDHILINEYGVFVIETKHFSGWLFGKEQDYNWTQSFNNGQKFQFQNPIIQNENHIKHLKKYLPLIPEKVFKSVIVFTGTAEFKTAPIKNVINVKDLVHYITQFKEKVLSVSEIEVIIGKLEFRRKEQSAKTDAEHIKYVQNKFGKKDVEKIAYLPRQQPNTWQDIRTSPRIKMGKFTVLLIKFVVIVISGFIFIAFSQNWMEKLFSKTQQSSDLTLSTPPIPQATVQYIQPTITAEKPSQPTISKTTASHRLGKICNTKKCIYQVEIVETTCYSATNSCQVTNKYKGTETEILAQ